MGSSIRSNGQACIWSSIIKINVSLWSKRHAYCSSYRLGFPERKKRLVFPQRRFFSCNTTHCLCLLVLFILLGGNWDSELEQNVGALSYIIIVNKKLPFACDLNRMSSTSIHGKLLRQLVSTVKYQSSRKFAQMWPTCWKVSIGETEILVLKCFKTHLKVSFIF